MKIGIFGHVGNENLGDEAIIAAVIQNTKLRYADAQIYGFTLNPADTEKRHNIPSFAIRRLPDRTSSQGAGRGGDSSAGTPHGRDPWRQWIKRHLNRIPVLYRVLRSLVHASQVAAVVPKEVRFLLDSQRRLKGLDLLIIAGSHQLNDFVEGPWSFPYTVLKWSMLARMSGVRLVFLSLGAGPINSRLGRLFIRRSLTLASYRSYRDETAKGVVYGLGVSVQQDVVPDLAFSLQLPAVPARVARELSVPIIGINPLPFHDAGYWYVSEPGRYESYVAKLACFADWLIDCGYNVQFISTQLRVDPGVIEDVKQMMKTFSIAESENRIIERPIRCLDDLISEMSRLAFVIATRYHGILLSLALHKPVLAIAYHPKSWDLMSRLGLRDYVVDGDTFDTGSLQQRFVTLESHGPAIALSLQENVPRLQDAVQAQYDEVFGLVKGPHVHIAREMDRRDGWRPESVAGTSGDRP